jgi:hypothetical protein
LVVTFLSSGAAVSAIVWLLAGPVPAAAQTLAPNPQIDIAYVAPSNPALVPFYQQLQSRKVLEALQLFLAPLKLPAGPKLTVKFDQCGGPVAALYLHGGPVTICYEYVAQVAQMVPRSSILLVQGTMTSDAALSGPVVGAVLHAVAVAVFDIFGVPVWGTIDDAADRLSAFLTLQFGADVAWNTIVGTAWYLSGNASGTPDYSAVSGTVAQRYYTTLCIAVGAQARGATTSPFNNFKSSGSSNAAAGDLPASRAQSCPVEYDTIKQAFDTLFVQGNLVDPAVMAQVQQAFVCNQGQAGNPLFQFACQPVQ